MLNLNSLIDKSFVTISLIVEYQDKVIPVIAESESGNSMLISRELRVELFFAISNGFVGTLNVLPEIEVERFPQPAALYAFTRNW